MKTFALTKLLFKFPSNHLQFNLVLISAGEVQNYNTKTPELSTANQLKTW